ncbi:hypothetical protein H4R34_002614 [Dimargaris verticillata]|uniref:Uncharacterized protein n=1 Tax=Dimargaris verticillata TaxID=2761393 RepID=A0A9W8E945_9FUNG|nr:hypothetical protein H4R34_002614 [Dimargaris verticillata]
MPVALPNGQPGLLAKGELGNAVKRELPLYDMDGVHDPELLMALFRDYTFLASAYLLEPCDILYRQTALYLENLDLVRGFRHKHWLFTKEYIIKYSNHPVATGGSPIVTWLPNQLNAVLEAIDEAAGHLDLTKLPTERRTEIEGIITRAATQRRVLAREVEELKQKFPNQDHLASG